MNVDCRLCFLPITKYDKTATLDDVAWDGAPIKVKAHADCNALWERIAPQYDYALPEYSFEWNARLRWAKEGLK